MEASAKASAASASQGARGALGVPPVEPPLGSFPAQGGSSVSPLIDGIPTFGRLCELMNAAKASVWIAVSFIDVARWRAPNGKSFFELLAAVAERGVDVRVLFWRLEFENKVLCNGHNFFGTRSDRAYLRDLPIAVRWDSSGPDHRHCHHEKSWVIDGCTSAPVAVQGGIVVTCAEMSSPGHPAHEVRAKHTFHDVNVEVRGLAAGDVAKHFVQRWNAARGHAQASRHWPDLPATTALPEPPRAEPDGEDRAQVLRTVRPGQLPCKLEGEASILEQYRAAIRSAQRSIYIENQHIAHPELLRLLFEACERGVKVVYLVPAALLQERTSWKRLARLVEAASGFLASSVWLVQKLLPTQPAITLNGERLWTPSYAEAFLTWVPRLAGHPNFCLAGLHVQDASTLRSVYVHSKLIIVDDDFLLVGSANLVDLSLERDHTELAVAAWGPRPARAARDALFEEHAGAPVPPEHGARPLEWLAAIARQNAARLRAGEPLVGRIAQIDGKLYGSLIFLVSFFVERVAGRGASAARNFD